MATVKVIRTDGKEAELLEKCEGALRLRLIPKVSTGDAKKELGDFLTNDKHENMYAIISRDDYNEKNISEAMRLGLVQLFKHLVEEEKKPEVILMDYYDFGGSKAENAFTCILKELMITYFGEAFTDEIALIIYNCKRDTVSLKI